MSIITVIYDKLAGLYSGLMLFTNEACAVRYFKTKITENASDFEMLKIGTYDPSNAAVTLCDKVIIAKGE